MDGGKSYVFTLHKSKYLTYLLWCKVKMEAFVKLCVLFGNSITDFQLDLEKEWNIPT